MAKDQALFGIIGAHRDARRRIHGRLLLAHWGSIVLAGEDRVPHIAAAEGGDYADDRFGGEATPDQAAAMGAEPSAPSGAERPLII